MTAMGRSGAGKRGQVLIYQFLGYAAAMARLLRLAYPGAFYYVSTRGNARQAIYLDDQDRQMFLSSLRGRANAAQVGSWALGRVAHRPQRFSGARYEKRGS